ARLLDSDRRPLLIGGDCTVLIGIAAALARTRPDAGLLFIDGHLDCYTPETSPTGEGADMEMAVLLGVGPPALLEFGERVPAVAHERVVILGPWDIEDAAADGAPDPASFAPGTLVVDGGELAKDPSGQSVSALERLAETARGFWLHVDLDVLSCNVLAAVDYADPRGLDADQLTAVLSPIVGSENLIGASVVILNPNLDDENGSGAKLVVDLLTAAIGG
ncbi:MAG TPA: arginase family protein, partial [Mycobacterium sp.]|nr:arginase family protein [Mycobacterium sp.]